MFFITGMPRTRSLWFAHYFSGLPHTFCYHELTNQCMSTDLFHRVMELELMNVGNSDGGLFVTDFTQRWPDAPIVVVERPVEAVHASLVEQGFDCPDGVLETIQGNLAAIEGLHVQYDDIDERLREIHEYLIDVPWSPGHAARMLNSQIQLREITGSPETFTIWKEAS